MTIFPRDIAKRTRNGAEHHSFRKPTRPIFSSPCALLGTRLIYSAMRSTRLPAFSQLTATKMSVYCSPTGRDKPTEGPLHSNRSRGEAFSEWPRRGREQRYCQGHGVIEAVDDRDSEKKKSMPGCFEGIRRRQFDISTGQMGIQVEKHGFL